MKKFTKGEWVADIRVGCCAVYPANSRDEWEQGLCSDDRNIYYSSYKNVSTHPNQEFESEEKRANAHLIAAAPEMYNFIKKCSLAFASDYPSLRDSANELLAKARGE